MPEQQTTASGTGDGSGSSSHDRQTGPVRALRRCRTARWPAPAPSAGGPFTTPGIMVRMPGFENARVVLLRHGETSWSVRHRHTGRTDLPLTDAGERQAVAAGPVVAGLGLRDPLILVSPRVRARRTADSAGLTGARIEPELAEWDYGDYEGRTTSQIRADAPGWTIWTGAVPGGESATEVSARADRILGAATVVLGERDVILVGHGHFSRALIARWLGFPVREGRRFALATAAVSVLGYEHDDPTLWAHNLRPAPHERPP